MKSVSRHIALIGALLICSLGVSKAQTFSLEDLLNGGSIICGDKVFKNFTNFISVGTGGADAPTAAEIFATCIDGGTQNPGLRWQSAKWNVNPGQTMDSSWEYDVQVLSANGLIHDADLQLVSWAADPDSDVHITESLDNGVNLLVDGRLGPFSDHHEFPPVKTLHVAKDISLEGHTTGQASVSTFDQHFSEVPELGTSTLLGGLSFAGLLGLRRRRR